MQTVYHLFDEKFKNCIDAKDTESKKSNVSNWFNTIRPTNQENATRTKEIIIIIRLNYTNFPPVTFLSHTILSSVFIVVPMLMWYFCWNFHSFRIHYPPSHKECILYISLSKLCSLFPWDHILLHSRAHFSYFIIEIHYFLTKGIFIRNHLSDSVHFSTNLGLSSQPIVQPSLKFQGTGINNETRTSEKKWL